MTRDEFDAAMRHVVGRWASRLPSEALKEELRQEVYVAALALPADIGAEAALDAVEAALARFVRRELRHLDRTESSDVGPEGDEVDHELPQPDEALHQKRCAEALTYLISKLPEPERSVATYRFDELRSQPEVAELTGHTVRHVQRVEASASQLMRERAVDEGIIHLLLNEES